VQEYHGRFNREQARMMSVIYRQRAGHSAPLAGDTPRQAEEIAAWWQAASQRELAALRHDWGAGI
jgi:hypothetical protein